MSDIYNILNPQYHKSVTYLALRQDGFPDSIQRQNNFKGPLVVLHTKEIYIYILLL